VSAINLFTLHNNQDDSGAECELSDWSLSQSPFRIFGPVA